MIVSDRHFTVISNDQSKAVRELIKTVNAVLKFKRTWFPKNDDIIYCVQRDDGLIIHPEKVSNFSDITTRWWRIDVLDFDFDKPFIF